MTDVTHRDPRPLASDYSAAPDEDVSVLRVLAVLLRERRTLTFCLALGFVVTVGLALLRERTYTSNFSFVPQGAPDANRSSLAGLAGQFGIALGSAGAMNQSPQLYADLLATREILVPIANDSFPDASGARVPLATLLDIDMDDSFRMDKLLRRLRQDVIRSSVATRTTGTISVTVTTPSPEASQLIADRLLQGVNSFNLVTRQSQAREERRFAGQRLDTARAALRAAEDAMAQFLVANRSFDRSPQLTFERDRLQREVTLQQQVVSGLAQNYEDARIREVRDTPVITVLEKPVRPLLPDPRGRLKLLAMGMAMAFVIGALLALGRDWLRRREGGGRDPEYDALRSEWQRLRAAKR